MTLTLPHLEVANASPVTAQLWIGGDLCTTDADLAGAQLDEMRRAGLTHIVDVRIEWDDSHWVNRAAPQIGYLHHGVDDAGQTIPEAWFDHGVTHILDSLSDPDAVVLTHCHMGINRGPSLGYAVLLAQGWDPIDALDVIRTARPIAYIAYAEDATRWWLHTTGATTSTRRTALSRIARWRTANHLDLAGVIRAVRTQEGSTR